MTKLLLECGFFFLAAWSMAGREPFVPLPIELMSYYDEQEWREATPDERYFALKGLADYEEHQAKEED